MSKFKDLVCVGEREKEKKGKRKKYKTLEEILEEEKEKGRRKQNFRER